MAWTPPKTYTSTTLSAAELNTYQRDNMSDLDERAPAGGVVQAWAHVTNSGTPTLDDHYNVSSLTDDGPGLTSVNFSTAVGDATYCCVATISDSSGGSGIYAVTLASGSVQIETENSAGTATDLNFTMLVYSKQ